MKGEPKDEMEGKAIAGKECMEGRQGRRKGEARQGPDKGKEELLRSFFLSFFPYYC